VIKIVKSNGRYNCVACNVNKATVVIVFYEGVWEILLCDKCYMELTGLLMPTAS